MPLSTITTKATNPGLQLLEDLLSWEPDKRPTAQQAMKYPFFELSKRSSANLMGAATNMNMGAGPMRGSQIIPTSIIPTDYLVTNSQFYQPVLTTKRMDNSSLINVSNSSNLGSQSVSTMNTINDILNNLNLNNTQNETGGGGGTRKELNRQSSKEKINELLLLSAVSANNADPVVSNKNSFRKGFFLHQPSTNFPDSGIGDEEEWQPKANPSYIKQVPVVVHNWAEEKAPPKRRLSNLSLMAKMAPVDKWGFYDDGIEGDNDGEDEEDEDDRLPKKYDFNNNSHANITREDDDELGRILG